MKMIKTSDVAVICGVSNYKINKLLMNAGLSILINEAFKLQSRDAWGNKERLKEILLNPDVLSKHFLIKAYKSMEAEQKEIE